jgi:hypothetical protein
MFSIDALKPLALFLLSLLFDYNIFLPREYEAYIVHAIGATDHTNLYRKMTSALHFKSHRHLLGYIKLIPPESIDPIAVLTDPAFNKQLFCSDTGIHVVAALLALSFKAAQCQSRSHIALYVARAFLDYLLALPPSTQLPHIYTLWDFYNSLATNIPHAPSVLRVAELPFKSPKLLQLQQLMLL